MRNTIGENNSSAEIEIYKTKHVQDSYDYEPWSIAVNFAFKIAIDLIPQNE